MKSLDGGVLTEKRGIEAGNIFQLGYHYSNLMHDAVYMDGNGDLQKYYMGCYGIGVGRTMAAIVEAMHDEKGMVWPMNIAPYHVYLARLGNDEAVVRAADELYGELEQSGFTVLYDDRDVRPGEKFADADLLGIPYRVVVSQKTVAESKVEVKERTSSDAALVTAEELKKLLQEKVA